jgi:hypothetical protein
MGLDDAIHAARQQADHWDSQRTQAVQREARERQEANDLLAEAVERLLPYGHEYYVQVQQRGRLGRYRGPNGDRYREVSRQRCWQVSDMAGKHPITGVWHTSPVLLLQDASAVRVWLDVLGAPGEYVSSQAPTELGPDYAPMLLRKTHGAWVDDLKLQLGQTVVRYERNGGTPAR